jgi:FkbM family methyltransferase
MKYLNPAVFTDDHEVALIEAFFGGAPSVFVDVGANLPENSISTPLERHGWTGVLVEPQPDCCEALRSVRTSPVVQCACVSQEDLDAGVTSVRLYLAGPQSSVDFDFISPRDRTQRYIDVPARTLNQVVADAGIASIDLLSLDTEGTEIAVLQGLDWKRYRPRLVLLEDHARDFSKHRFMKSLGYKLFRRTGFNSWYARVPDALPISPWGYLQLLRKYVLGMPVRNFRRWRHERLG